MNDVEKIFQQQGGTGFLVGRTVIPGVSGADAVLWTDGIVRGVGPAADLVRSAPPGCPVFEYPGALITPGFIDAHTHFAQWALKRRQVDLTGAGTRAEAVRRVAAGVPEQGWVLGQGWDANGWSDPPTRGALDQVQPGPVFLDSLDVHAAWVNSPALAAGGVSRHTPDPPAGRVVQDGSGEPTGLLLEQAVELVRRVVPVPPAERLREALIAGQGEAHRLGVTGIHDVEELRILEAFRSLDREDRLRLRVLFHPPAAELPRLTREGFQSGAGSGWITQGGVKLFLDGSLGSRTAWMLEPYEGSRDRGMPLASWEEAAAAVRMAAAQGISATVHAIGDAAVRRALDLLEPLPRLRLPHRIEHFQCVDPADAPRAARAGIILSMQPAHLLVDAPLADRHWGRRGRGTYQFRTLAAHGSVLAFGSDAPVAPLDPRPGVFAAMDRRALGSGRDAAWYAAERIPFDAVVRGYTEAPAQAAGWAPRLGTLVPGAAADLVAWDVDPAVHAGDGQAFLEARVRLTVVNGEIMVQT